MARRGLSSACGLVFVVSIAAGCADKDHAEAAQDCLDRSGATAPAVGPPTVLSTVGMIPIDAKAAAVANLLEQQSADRYTYVAIKPEGIVVGTTDVAGTEQLLSAEFSDVTVKATAKSKTSFEALAVDRCLLGLRCPPSVLIPATLAGAISRGVPACGNPGSLKTLPPRLTRGARAL